MKSNDAILTALLILLVIIVAYQGSCWMKGRSTCDGFASPGAPHQLYPGSTYNPYTVLNKRLDAIRGYRDDGYNQTPWYRLPHGLDRYHRSGAHLKPEEIADAERAQWYDAVSEGFSGTYNTELAHDAAADTMQYHSPAPVLDHDTYITDLITDPRVRENHRRWVEEMKPWSGTAMKVDNLEVGDYIDFTGLRRPQAVVQYNPLQLTEIGTEDIASNHKFNFQG